MNRSCEMAPIVLWFLMITSPRGSWWLPHPRSSQRETISTKSFTALPPIHAIMRLKLNSLSILRRCELWFDVRRKGLQYLLHHFGQTVENNLCIDQTIHCQREYIILGNVKR